ncbi:TonB-dependent receptor [Hyphomonas oceanitis]|uniref:TonB-dependent receptor n=1 Tax=Hyphomonas oceanitis TaxID=81033 RepID=UPI0030030348
MPHRLIATSASLAVLATCLAEQAAAQLTDEEIAALPLCISGQVDNVCRDDAGHVSIFMVHERKLSPVEVWGDRSENDPGSYAAVFSDQIAAIDADHPAEILNTLPGVNIQMNSGQEHLIAIRSPVLTGGAGQGSFLILENGVPTRSPAFGNVNSLMEPHHEVAEAIEVVRGPGSAKYGSNAVHGLVNVILGKPGDGSFASASYGTLGRYRTDAALDDGEHVRLGLSLQHDNGWRDNTGIDQQKFSAVGAYTLGAWDMTPWLSASNLNQESAGFVNGTDSYKDRDLVKQNPNPEAYRDAWSARLGMRAERALGPGTLVLTPYAHSQAMIFSQHFLPNGGVEKNGHTGGGLMARFGWQASDNVELRLGADVDVASGYLKEIQPDSFGFFPGDGRFPQGVHYDYTVDTTELALWGEAEFALGKNVSVLAGLRGETHEYDYSTAAPVGINGRFNVPADRTDSFDLLTPKLGLIWSPGDISYYVNYARGERAPQASDLYRLQSLQVAGQVKTETLDSVEFGARGSAVDGRLVFDVAAYWMDKENFFFRDSDGLNVPDGSTRHVGIEAAGAFDITDTLVLKGNVSWSDQTYTFDRIVNNSATEIIRDGTQIDTAPEWLADASLDWQATEALGLSLSVEHVGEYYMDPANTATYPGHTVLSARGSYAFGEGTEVFLIVRNLTDEAYADRADLAFGNGRYFPGEPLNATLGVRKTF